MHKTKIETLIVFLKLHIFTYLNYLQQIIKV